MTDNYKKMYQYMEDLGIAKSFDDAIKSDLFFDVQLIHRGKDHPNMPAANYNFKTYYIDSLEQFDRYWGEIKTCCEMFGLRAYISVNAKEKTEAAKKTLERYAHDIVTNDYRKPWKDFSSVCGGLNGSEKRWIIDIDDCDDIDTYLNKICETIRICDSGYDDPIVTIITTRTGFHIITHPFNIQMFNNKCYKQNINTPDIKKNHITLLYENLEKFNLKMNKMDLKTVLEELKETHTLNTIIQHFDMEDVIDCFWEDDVVDYLDSTHALETTKQYSYNEGYADAIETNKTRENLVENFNNSNTDDKFRFLCDLFGIGYYDNTQQLRNSLNEIINKTIYNKNENHC